MVLSIDVLQLAIDRFNTAMFKTLELCSTAVEARFQARHFSFL